MPPRAPTASATSSCWSADGRTSHEPEFAAGRARDHAMTAVEANFDGLVGPTHNYAGLSFGNVASFKNEQRASTPREAALQGLRKVKALADLGLVQGVLPPHERPHIPTLRK